jgi:hypothetical protein
VKGVGKDLAMKKAEWEECQSSALRNVETNIVFDLARKNNRFARFVAKHLHI